MFFSRAPAGGQSLPIPSIEHRRSAPAKLVLRVRAGALRPHPATGLWCAPWLVLFFVRVTSIEHRQSAPGLYRVRFGLHRSGFLFLPLASATSIDRRQSAPWPFRERFGIASPRPGGHGCCCCFCVRGAEGKSSAAFCRRPSDSGAGRQPTA